MTDKTTDSLTQLYAQASAVHTADAPPALSAAIMQAAAQAVAVQNTAPTQATVQPSLPAQKRWATGLGLLPMLFNKAASNLQNIFTIPTIRYGLPAMMVAAVGFKIALPEVPSQQDSSPPTVAAPAMDGGAPAAAAPALSSSTIGIAANGAVSTTAKNSAKAAAPSGATVPAIAVRRETQPTIDSTLADAPSKDAVFGNNKNSGAADAMDKNLNSPAASGFKVDNTAPQAFPAQQTTLANKAEAELSRADSLPVPAKAAAAMPVPAAAPAAMTAPAPSLARAAAPMIAARASSELSSDIPKDMRLRWLIATSRMVDGVPTETCNSQAPDLERVKSWISASANPHYRPANIPNAPSTLALALRCGFSEAAAAMQASPLKQ